MKLSDLQELESLLLRYRDDSIDREEFDKRESLRFDVEFDIVAQGVSLGATRTVQIKAPMSNNTRHTRTVQS